jgi:DNA-binding YbaB/EbfC family protein
MFGDLSGMMNQLQQAQQKIEETKKRLDTVLIDEETSGKVKVTVTANREIKSIQVDDSLLEDAEELEDYLVLTLNKALARANEIHEQEMAAAAKTNMPNIPGMDMFK